MRGIALLALCCICISGCHRQQLVTAPQFNLDALPDRWVKAPLEVTIEDKRPEWERNYFEGDVTLFPLEQMTPSPIDRLQREVEDRARELPDLPSGVRLDLESFRVVHCTDPSLPRLAPVWLGFPIWPFLESTGGNGYAALIGIGIYVAIIGTVELSILGYDVAATAIRYAHYYNAKPRELVVSYPAGMTCDIRGIATLDWPDGRHKKLDVHALVNRPELMPQVEPTRDQVENIRPLVTTACKAFGQEFWERALYPGPAPELGPRQPIPMWTSYSGN
jgi:hypothetical protein